MKALDSLYQESTLIDNKRNSAQFQRAQVLPPASWGQTPESRPWPTQGICPRALPFTKPCFWKSLRNNKETEEKSKERPKERDKPEKASEEQKAEGTDD